MREPKPRVPTIRDVAERADVSVMTVSNVVNRTAVVRPEKERRVRDAIAALGYVPNVNARRLAQAKATKIGLLYGLDCSSFLNSLIVGALHAANAHGLQLVLHEGGVRTVDGARTAALELVRGGAEALLLSSAFAELLSGTGFLESLDLPAATIATGQPLSDLTTVRIDNRGAMAAMTARLIELGHRRLGFVAGAMSFTDSIERLNGYQDALRGAGLEQDRHLICDGDYTYESGEQAADFLLALAQPPTAIVCSNDEMAAGVVAAAWRCGLRLPEELAVTGFDDTLIASNVWPRLTVVRQPIEVMASLAVEQLVRNIAGTEPGLIRDSIVEYEIVERESTLRRSIAKDERLV